MGDRTDITFVDTETSGIDPNVHEIIEIAAVRIDLDTMEEKARMHRLVRPFRPVPAEAAAINGYTPERWAAEQVELSEALDLLHPVLEGACWAGQNPAFDRRFIDLAYAAEGREPPKLGSYRMLDISSLAWPLFVAGRIEGVGLRYTRKFFGMGGEQKHGALEDTLEAIAVYKKIMARYLPLELFAKGATNFLDELSKAKAFA